MSASEDLISSFKVFLVAVVQFFSLCMRWILKRVQDDAEIKDIFWLG